eukprot:CAMPEP_0205903096 /NCGR_PEP_ID=MMETSP1083-20121108/28559_1 /ASSEMBLY_ACC=CAM_ASM_000430 /TAXON_ID=97485 /ORGANISM="Prymnesium parvum, Strain Texoma1" /LENGTH=149 /DNA_ID=CAMNT_0053268721 /DNA_START=165 /DNA_END=611 /DNA_ORIENTATION=+
MSQAECQAQRLPVEYREHLLPPRCRCCKHLRAAASPASFQLVAMASDPGARGVGNREVTVTAKVGCDAGQAPAATVGPVMAENGASHPAADDAAGMPSAARHMPPSSPRAPKAAAAVHVWSLRVRLVVEAAVSLTWQRSRMRVAETAGG